MIKLVQNPKRYYWKRKTAYDVIPWTRPNLTANGTIGGSSFACTAINAYSGAEAYKAFDSSTSTNWEVVNKTAFPHWIEWYNPNALKATQVEVTHGTVTHVGSSTFRRCFIKEWKLQASEDGNTWVDITSGTVSSSDVQMHRPITISISNTTFYKYWKFFVLSVYSVNNYAQIYDIAITATQKVPRTFIIPGTETDYDYYTDGFEYKALKEETIYKGVNQ